MAVGIDVGTQTDWAGLVKHDLVRPDTFLVPPSDTPTPPDDMLTEKPQFIHAVPEIRRPPPVKPTRPFQTASLLERRANRANLDPHFTLPLDELNDEVPLSPPTSRALLSPLPEANKRHAGHTPLIDRALSPAEEAEVRLPVAEELEVQAPAEDRAATPDLDEALTGALTLPPNPVDGAEDHIELSALDKVLGKIAKQQAVLRGEFDDDETSPKTESTMPVSKRRAGSKSETQSDALEMTDDGLALSRKGSADSHRSGATEEIDGIILKTPPSNFGAPLGSL
ncbi:hypothetical protein DE146DRAFT_317713 [Phaeosphaeria sp. MPI-PUGE-AT-0046c]|nr:hypothetical protein DE146DRAFT_317713 [Phaeosphaeria sp. MPI-PUGE-AT-0046c]